MKAFPSKRYTAQLRESGDAPWERLRQVTLVQDALVSTFTSRKRFIGQVRLGRFKLIRAAIGRGAFCTFTGLFNDGSGTIDVRIHKAFRVIMLIWLVLPIVGILLAFFQQGIVAALQQLVLIVLLLIVLRLGVERFFRSMAATGLRELSEILELEHVSEVKEERA